jgi:hypothetical protein
VLALRSIRAQSDALLKGCLRESDCDASPGPIDLDALDDYLMSDHAPDDSMGLSDLDGFLTGIVVGPDGFLTGIVVGPELIPPSEGCR